MVFVDRAANIFSHMPKIIELASADARAHFLKGSSYFNNGLPNHISFEPILQAVSLVLAGRRYAEFKSVNPHTLPNVNYSFTANKDGKFAWRPLELIHPVLYVSLVNAQKWFDKSEQLR